MGKDVPADDDNADDVEDAEEDGDVEEEPTIGVGDGDTPAAASDKDTPPADAASRRPGKARDVTLPDTSGDVESSLTAAAGQSTGSGGKHSQMLSVAALADTPASYSFAPASADALTTAATKLNAAAAAPAVPAQAVPQQRPTLVSVVSDLVAAVLQPLLSPGTGSPIQIPLLSAVLSLVRDEIERIFFPRTAKLAAQQETVQFVDFADLDDSLSPKAATPDQHVLLIGVDGTNLSRILADDYNQEFFGLMADGTTAASTIVGHTTISNPSWTTILTGVWGETSGVINNIFTPWTYDTWPTVFNQLETFDPTIETTAIADSNVNTAIAGAGSIPADNIVFIPQVEGDTNWLATDDAVGEATIEAINKTPAGATPSFIFTYFAGVDKNGHLYGGDSLQYANAIRNVNDNLVDIMDAVEDREACGPGPCEDWTVIVVTDHGHVGPPTLLGRGHGFQSPDETSTFVIADGPDFEGGLINNTYRIVDITPTVVSLFGLAPEPYFEGVPLMDRSGSTVDPGANLFQVLNDSIDMYGYPDPVTNAALVTRTIFALVPYFVYTFTNDITAQLQAIGGLGAVAAVAIRIVGDLLYVATNIPAQIVARLTGVTGASIFPLFPPEPPSTPTLEQATLPDPAILACDDGSLLRATCIAS